MHFLDPLKPVQNLWETVHLYYGIWAKTISYWLALKCTYDLHIFADITIDVATACTWIYTHKVPGIARIILETKWSYFGQKYT